MEDIYKNDEASDEHPEERALFLERVIQNDSELLELDRLLKEAYRKK